MNTSLNHALEKEVKHSKGVLLDVLRRISENLAEAEEKVNILRDRKWDLVKLLKDMGHDFTTTAEGMDVVLSAPPSMKWS